MEAYKKWVRDNRNYLYSFESLANGLTWLLPERFSNSEIGPEAVSAAVGVITAVNEHIIETAPTQMRVNATVPPSFPYSLCISALKNLEPLIEVAAQQYYGNDKRWNFIAVTEAMKVLFRLALFKNSGYKMILEGGETTNNETHLETSTSQHRANDGHHASGYLGYVKGHNQWSLEGRAMSALSMFGDNARINSTPAWSYRVQHERATFNPPATIPERPTLLTILSEQGRLGALFVIGEVLFITRPLIYVLLIRKYGIRSWTPWFLSLAVDLIGTSFLSYATSTPKSREDQRFHLSDSEKDEVRGSLIHHSSPMNLNYHSRINVNEFDLVQLRRRKMLWAFYIMRDPFFGRFTRRKLEGAEKVLQPVPFVGFLTAKIVELMVGAQTRYTYMSAS
ncbi:peroxisome biogenesis protein 16 isoform X1 [Cucurbita maxima]|uniref:Peroxisomal membrane protein PEX16 n=2 Tax=Cucurbita maxima TaxID=3661 RepID=A0A6J1KE71_CUCMA|nr:peroxisome biogenesis protein 16 isoform X1 [Cucurbita maxima]